MPEARLERTRQAYRPPVVGSYEWAIECERVRLREQERGASDPIVVTAPMWVGGYYIDPKNFKDYMK